MSWINRHITNPQENTMIKDLIQTFRKPSPLALAEAELADARRSLLEAQSAAEYAKSMSDYHSERIRRLTTFLKSERKDTTHAA